VYYEEQKRWDLRFGVVASTVINWSGRNLKEGADPISAGTLFGYADTPTTSVGQPELTPAQQMAAWRAAFPPPPPK